MNLLLRTLSECGLNRAGGMSSIVKAPLCPLCFNLQAARVQATKTLPVNSGLFLS